MIQSLNRLYVRVIGTISVLLAFTFYSCIKEYEKPIAKTDYSPLLAVPLINSSMTVKDLLLKDYKGGNIQTDSNNLLTLVYRGRLISLPADTIIHFPTQSFSATTPAITNADITAFGALPTGATFAIPPFTDTIEFNTNNTADLDSVVFKPGTLLSFNINSMFMQNATVLVTIPTAKKNGVPLSQTFNITYSGTVPVLYNGNINLSGYTIDMTEGGTTSNKFNINFSVTLTKSTSNPLHLSDKATFTMGFNSPLFEKLFGYIMQPLLSPRIDTVPITIFTNIVPNGGKFTLVNPQIRFIVSNSYGVPINATFNTLEGYTPPSSVYPVTITDPNLMPWKMPYPGISQIGQSIRDSITLSNANTANTLGNVLNQTPKNFVYSVNAQANPNGKPTTPNTNFALDTSRFIVDFQFNLPLWGTASNIMLMDTIPLSLQSTDLSNVESLLIRINGTNGFPINMGLQGYFTDSISPTQKYNILDSIVSPYQVIIPSANVDTTTGIVKLAINKITDNTFDITRVNKIKNTQKLIIKGLFVTANNGKTNVKLFSTYFLDVKIGILAKMKAKI